MWFSVISRAKLEVGNHGKRDGSKKVGKTLEAFRKKKEETVREGDV